MKTVNLAYIEIVYNYVYGLLGEGLLEEDGGFNINSISDRMRFFEEARKEVERYGPKTQQGIIDALEYVLSVSNIEDFYRAIFPHHLPIDLPEGDVRDYVRQLYQVVIGRKPTEDSIADDVNLEYFLPKGWNPRD